MGTADLRILMVCFDKAEGAVLSGVEKIKQLLASKTILKEAM